MENLPLDITAHILSRLPIESRLRCREVCTTWGTLLPKPKMGLLYGASSSHLKTAAEDVAEFYFSEQDDVKEVRTNHVDDDEERYHNLIMPVSSSNFKSFMVGSCNGLVCYASFSRSIDDPWETYVYICNPVTGEQIQLPIALDYVDQAIGFGYNPSSKEYKVVRILRDPSSHFDAISYRRQVGRVQVHTLLQGGGNDWKIRSRVMEKRFWSRMRSRSPPLVGVFAGGALHWIFPYMEPEVIAFDLEHERFKFLPSIIPFVGAGSNNHVELMVLGGNLCVLEVELSKHITIWESNCRPKLRRRCVSTWVTKFIIAWEDYRWFDPFVLTKSDTCLVWYNAVLSCYDPETKTFRKLDETLKNLIDGFTTSSMYATSQAIPHINSLVSLEAITEERVGKKRRKALELGREQKKRNT